MKLKDKEILYLWKKQYAENGKNPIIFDFKKNAKVILNGHERINNLNYLHSYPGRISPYIAMFLLSLNELKHLKGYVLDPFAGTGTVLLESLTNPFIKRSALGVEINPLARLISKVKTSSLDKKVILKHLYNIKKRFRETKRNDFKIPDFTNIDLWFSQSSKYQLAKLKFSIDNEVSDTKYHDFFKLCFSKLIRKVSKADPNIPPPVVLKPKKYKTNKNEYEKLKAYLEYSKNPKVLDDFEICVNENSKISKLNYIEEFKNKTISAKIISNDARDLVLNDSGIKYQNLSSTKGKLKSNIIDIILTSPPYLTAQKYIRSTRLELMWLGYTTKQLVSIEKKSIGTESLINKGLSKTFDIKSIDELLKFVFTKSEERYSMIYEYFYSMNITLKELYRVLKKGGYAFFVLGDNFVLKKHVKTYKLVLELAKKNGFKEIITLKNKIQKRSMMANRNGSGGLIKFEYILILKK